MAVALAFGVAVGFGVGDFVGVADGEATKAGSSPA